jgi:hypothetical protein
MSVRDRLIGTRIDRCLFKPSKLGEFCGAADLEGRRCLALLTGNQNAMDGFARSAPDEPLPRESRVAHVAAGRGESIALTCP